MNTKRLLLIDDSESYQFLIQNFFEKQQFTVRVIDNANSIVSDVIDYKPSIILLDLGLPGEDGFDACDQLKSSPMTKNIPILFLTNDARLDSKLKGFSKGAHDYIDKSAALDEILARVERTIQQTQKIPNEIKVNSLIFNYKQKTVLFERHHLAELKLSPVAFFLLLLLAKKEPQVLARSEVYDELQNLTHSKSKRMIDVYVTSLRKKLKNYDLRIETVYGQGYRLISQV